MPIYELGYRHWEGRRLPSWLRWWTIARSGIALAFRSKVLRRLLFVAWAPLLYFGPLFFAVGYVTDPARPASARSEWAGFARAFLGPEMGNRLVTDPESLRPLVWSAIFSHFFMYSQSFLTFLVLAIVGPPLIAQDVRGKAFLLYFSKPITRAEYLLGKASTAFFFVFLVTLFPGLVLYAVSVAFSPSWAVLGSTGATLWRMGAASLVIATPGVLLVLLFSSLTSEGRYAGFGWIAAWLLGELFFQILEQVPGLRGSGWIFLPSLRETTSVLVGAVFDIESVLRAADQLTARGTSRLAEMLHSPYSPARAAGYWAVLCASCLAVLTRRISAPLRV